MNFIVLKRNTATCKIALYGATITHFSTGKTIFTLTTTTTTTASSTQETDTDADDANLLFVSREAVVDGSKPIRGGVPLVFPIFGAGDGSIALPSHGFARVSTWRVLEQDESSGKGDDSRVVLVLEPSDVAEPHTKAWPYQFRLEYEVAITPALELSTRLRVHNKHESSFRFQSLLHTYFKVPDARELRVNINKRTEYVDQVAKRAKLEMETTVVRVERETDYIYAFSTSSRGGGGDDGEEVVDLFYSVSDFEKGRVGMRQTRKFTLGAKRRACDLVLWNPWVEKSKKMADFGDEEYLEMICLEPGNVANTAGDELPAGEFAELSQLLRFGEREGISSSRV